MAEKKFSELATASQIEENDIAAISHETSGVWGSFKATIGAIAQKIITNINFTSAFNTNAKTVAGAINEKLTSNAVADIEVSPAESAHSEGDYLIYNGLLYLVVDDIAIGDALTTGAGGNIETAQIADGIGGGGGHEILNDAGSALPQENKLQFKGVYSHDDSTNGKTVIDVTREMTQAEYDLLSADEKKGIIRITDDNYVCDGTEVKYSTGVSVKEKIDDVDGKTADDIPYSTGVSVKDKIDTKANKSDFSNFLYINRLRGGVKTIAQLNAHTGMPYYNLTGEYLSAPEIQGYTFLGHFYVEVGGFSGLFAFFDDVNKTATRTNVNPFVFNASNSDISTGTNLAYGMISLYQKNL